MRNTSALHVIGIPHLAIDIPDNMLPFNIANFNNYDALNLQFLNSKHLSVKYTFTFNLIYDLT